LEINIESYSGANAGGPKMPDVPQSNAIAAHSNVPLSGQRGKYKALSLTLS